MIPSLIKHPSLIGSVLRHSKVFRLGFQEAYSSDGMTYDGDPWSDRSMAYDAGRDLRCWGRA